MTQTLPSGYTGLVGSLTLPGPALPVPVVPPLWTLLPEPDPKPEPEPELPRARAKPSPGGPRSVAPGPVWMPGTSLPGPLALGAGPGSSSSGVLGCVKPETSLSIDEDRPLVLDWCWTGAGCS